MQNIFFPSQKARFADKNEVVEKFGAIARELSAKDGDISRMILFGSYAEGGFTPRSDADILVVLKDSTGETPEKTESYILAFSNGPVPADVFVRNEAGVKRMLDEGNGFIRRALGGVVLAEKPRAG